MITDTCAVPGAAPPPDAWTHHPDDADAAGRCAPAPTARSRRYGWLGDMQQPADDLGGLANGRLPRSAGSP